MVLAMLYFVRNTCCSLFYIPTESMTPTVKPNDIVFVNRLAYGFRIFGSYAVDFAPIKVGDIVVFIAPNKQILLKRVGQILSNGTYWMLGDNTAKSADSRVFGAIEKNKILGRMRRVL